MRLRYRSVLLLVAVCCLAFAVAPAFAAKPAPTTLPAPTSTVPHVEGTSAPPVCRLGVLPPSNIAYGYILPPDDAYYTLIAPGTGACAGYCTGQPLRLTAAHVEHFFVAGEAACTIPVTISIVGAINPTGGCFRPDPSVVICPPTQYAITTNPAQAGVCVDFSFPLPAACCISGPVFLHIEYDQGSCGNSRPAFCGQNPCTSGLCFQYNFYPPAFQDDLCNPAVLGRNVTMYADVECCAGTPTLPGSWGTVKTLYR